MRTCSHYSKPLTNHISKNIQEYQYACIFRYPISDDHDFPNTCRSVSTGPSPSTVLRMHVRLSSITLAEATPLTTVSHNLLSVHQQFFAIRQRPTNKKETLCLIFLLLSFLHYLFTLFSYDSVRRDTRVNYGHSFPIYDAHAQQQQILFVQSIDYRP